MHNVVTLRVGVADEQLGLGSFAIAIRLHDAEANGAFDQLASNHSRPFEPLELSVNCGPCSMRVGMERTGDLVPADRRAGGMAVIVPRTKRLRR